MFDGFMEWYVMKKKFVFPKICIFIVGVVMLEMYLILISVFFFIGVFKLLKV